MQLTHSITYGEAENLIDCGGKFVSAGYISLARSAGMTIELVKIPFVGKIIYVFLPKEQELG